MASILEWLRGGGPDCRPKRAIEDDVAEELRFHIDEATDDGVCDGLSREQARAAAMTRFGDVDAIRERCVRVRVGGSAMLIKIMAAALLLLGVLSGTLYVGMSRAQAAQTAALEAHGLALQAALEARELARQASVASAASASADPDAWLARFQAEPDDWRLGWAVAQELVAALSAEDAWSVMRGVFPKLSTAQRCQALKPFVFRGGHAHALDVLDLAMNDPDAEVRERARGYLREYAFVAFEDGDPRYGEWRASIAGESVGSIVERGLLALSERLKSLPPSELIAEIHRLRGLTFEPAERHGLDVAALLRSAGLDATRDQLKAETERLGAQIFSAESRAQVSAYAELDRWLH